MAWQGRAVGHCTLLSAQYSLAMIPYYAYSKLSKVRSADGYKLGSKSWVIRTQRDHIVPTEYTCITKKVLKRIVAFV